MRNTDKDPNYSVLPTLIQKASVFKKYQCYEKMQFRSMCQYVHAYMCMCVCFFLVEIGEFKGSLNFNLLQEEKYCLSY